MSEQNNILLDRLVDKRHRMVTLVTRHYGDILVTRKDGMYTAKDSKGYVAIQTAYPVILRQAIKGL